VSPPSRPPALGSTATCAAATGWPVAWSVTRPRTEAAPAGAVDTVFDEEGRPFHTHADGAVHYLDEE